MKTKVRVSDNNGKEFGYKSQYIMIDVVVDEDTTLPNMAESPTLDPKDIRNARRRAIAAARRMFDWVG